jgi:hypothetical protein
MSHYKVSIKIAIEPTEDKLSPEGQAQKVSDGHFQLVLENTEGLDIDGLEQGLLSTNYPALRDALAQHLESELKKKPAKRKASSRSVQS